MRLTCIVMLALFSTSLMAEVPFCSRTRTSINDLLAQPENRLDFKNRGGLFGGGVCWWHSRLQRSSLYLARFAPDRPKPDLNQIKQIIYSLKKMNRVVVIPGYSDFLSFSHDHQRSIQNMLEFWQKEDGLLNFQWLRGISGRYVLPAKELEERMHMIYRIYQQSPSPLWVMAQMKGITSHSYLIRQIEVLPSGYVLEVVDSNKPKELRYARYQFGDQSLLVDGSKKNFIPYVGFQEDFRRIAGSLAAYCKPQQGFIETEPLIEESIPAGEIETNL